MTLEFYISYKVNEGLLLNPSELIEQYLYGIPLTNKDNTSLAPEVIKQKIVNAQDYVEKWLGIKLNRTVYTESADFIRTDYNNWGFLRLTYPIVEPGSLIGYVGTVRQIEYPLAWVSVSMKYEDQQYRTINIVPAGSTNVSAPQSIIFSGITPHLGFMGMDSIPNYWHIEYMTGFSGLPGDILEFIGKLVAIEVLAILGDIAWGAGLSNLSLSLDGLSQSIGTTKGGGKGAYAGRIEQFIKDLEIKQKFLRDYYKGITFMAM